MKEAPTNWTVHQVHDILREPREFDGARRQQRALPRQPPPHPARPRRGGAFGAAGIQAPADTSSKDAICHGETAGAR